MQHATYIECSRICVRQDRDGRPYAAGRLRFANAENMWPD